MAHRYHWRCSKQACRARHHGARHPDEYVKGWKCKACGGSKFVMVKDIIADSGHIDCQCGAYPRWQDERSSGPAPHRRGSRACLYNRDGSMRQIIRKHEDRLHPWARRMLAENDKHGPVFWFYDGEAEYEAAWASEPDKSVAQFGGVQSLLELQEASSRRGQPCAPGELAQWVDGATRARDAAVGRFRAYSRDLRRGR